MAEPPKVPNADWPHRPGDDASNPFAPSAVIIDANRLAGRTDLSPAYTASLVILFGLLVAATISGLPLVWVGAATLVAAAIRVPLLQRRLSRFDPTRRLPSALTLLMSSWLFMFIFTIVSCIAFAAICIPSSLFALGTNGADESLVWGVSILAGCFCFSVLFFASLRLPF
jgi:hypothetical protein